MALLVTVMAQCFDLHPDNPQPRFIKEAVKVLRGGGVMAYPTDASYALGCMLDNKAGMERIRALRGVDEKHHFTLICRDLSEIAKYARVDNKQYRILRAGTPGGYTFILEATREVPRRLQHPKRSTIGLRVPDHPVVNMLLEELGEPILSMTLQLAGEEEPLNDPDDIQDRLGCRLDLVMVSGYGSMTPTTVIDLSSGVPELLRTGTGDPAKLGF